MTNPPPPAANYTDQVSTPCEKAAVFAVDVLDSSRRLLVTHVSLDETLAQCGIDPTGCALLEEWINKERTGAGKPKLTAAEKIWPGTTIRKVVGHVC